MNNKSLVDFFFSGFGFSAVMSPKKSILPVNLRSLVAVKFLLIVSLFSSIFCLISSNLLYGKEHPDTANTVVSDSYPSNVANGFPIFSTISAIRTLLLELTNAIFATTPSSSNDA